MLLLPRASSLIAMSATLVRLAVFVFSARETMVVLSATAVGGWFCPTTSSLRMVPLAAPVAMVAPVGLLSVTVKASSSSTTVSPLTWTVIVWLLSPAAKVTVPEGSAAAPKSTALAGLEPEPLTAQAAEERPLVSPVRLTAKLKALEPASPSS